MAPPEAKWKKVRDPIHDYIPLDEATLAVADAGRMQRLRRICQLGTAYLVYPGARHSRFEHGLGAQHLARLAGDALGLAADEALDLRLAALCHDVGHGPFSHLSDAFLREFTGRGHADVSREVVGGILAPTIERHGGDPKRVSELIGGEGRLGDLVAGELDVDRMDYLVRDSHYTGVDIGVDLYRLVTELRVASDGRLALDESAIPVAEMLLATRATMYATVYLHPTCRAAEVMLERAMRLAIDVGELDPAQLPLLDDVDVIARLRASATKAAMLVNGLDNRRLLKLAAAFRYDELPAGFQDRLHADPHRRAAAESQIAGALGVDAVGVVLDAPEPPLVPEVNVRVLAEGGVVPLRERSALVEALPRARLDHWRLRVYVPARAREAARAVAQREVLRALA